MNTRILTRTALFAALTAAGAFIRIPLGYSSVTLQFLCTAMAGCLLGPACGAASQAVYVALGLLGLPIFTQGGGLSYLLQPTCGFLLGLIPSAWVIGLLTARRPPHPLRTALACFAGLAVLYAVGLPYMAVILNRYMGKAMDFTAIPLGRHAAVPARRHAEDRRYGCAGPAAAEASVSRAISAPAKAAACPAFSPSMNAVP